MRRRATLVLAVIGLIMAGCDIVSTATAVPLPPSTTVASAIATSPPLTPTSGPPEPVTIQAGDCIITFLGDFEAVQGEKLVLRFQVDCGGAPGQGTFFATLGDPPGDTKATHGNGELDAEGKITLTLEVNWPAGTTKLYCSYNDEVYEVTEITVME